MYSVATPTSAMGNTSGLYLPPAINYANLPTGHPLIPIPSGKLA
jgi:hypothetical protein